jgi:hypothetical protein
MPQTPLGYVMQAIQKATVEERRARQVYDQATEMRNASNDRNDGLDEHYSDILKGDSQRHAEASEVKDALQQALSVLSRSEMKGIQSWGQLQEERFGFYVSCTNALDLQEAYNEKYRQDSPFVAADEGLRKAVYEASSAKWASDPQRHADASQVMEGWKQARDLLYRSTEGEDTAIRTWDELYDKKFAIYGILRNARAAEKDHIKKYYTSRQTPLPHWAQAAQRATRYYNQSGPGRQGSSSHMQPQNTGDERKKSPAPGR